MLSHKLVARHDAGAWHDLGTWHDPGAGHDPCAQHDLAAGVSHHILGCAWLTQLGDVAGSKGQQVD